VVSNSFVHFHSGSGKTAAYLIPIVAAMLNNNSAEPASSYDPVTHTRKYAPIGLVLSPTRELATQIYEQSRKVFAEFLSLNSVFFHLR
jgi:ATP-dependent RNA helicase DDX3X